MRRLTCLFLALLMLLSLPACGGSEPSPSKDSPAQEEASAPADAAPQEEPVPESEAMGCPPPAYTIYDPTVMPEGGVRDGVTYVEYTGVVEHLFFHPVIAYPEQAFDGDHMSNGYDDWMVTVDEYNKILQSV